MALALYPQQATVIRGQGFIRSGGVPRIDWKNPLTAGLTGCWLFNGAVATGVGAPALRNLVTGYIAPSVNSTGGFYGTPASSRYGRGNQPNSGSLYWSVDAASKLYGASLSVGIVRRFTNTTMQGAAAFGDGGSLNCHFPYSDNTVYWDFPNSGSRVSFAYTPSTLPEAWVLTGGAAGRWIWKDGVQKLTNTSTVTTGSPSGNFRLNQSAAIGGYTNQEWYLACTWNRQLRQPECTAWTLDPLQFVIWPDDQIAALLVGIAGGGTTTVTLDALLAAEFLATQRRDGMPNTEFLAGLSTDRLAYLEDLSLQLADRPVPVEALATQLGDGRVYDEILATLRGDGAAQTEILAGLSANRSIAVEMLAGVSVDRPLATESLGLIAVTADGVFALEWSGAIRRDGAVAAESAALVIADRAAGAEILRGVAADGRIALEALGAILANHGALPVESLGTVNAIMADGLIPLEWQQVTILSLNRGRLLVSPGKARRLVSLGKRRNLS